MGAILKERAIKNRGSLEPTMRGTIISPFLKLVKKLLIDPVRWAEPANL
jgi:hypothetical protein